MRDYVKVFYFFRLRNAHVLSVKDDLEEKRKIKELLKIEQERNEKEKSADLGLQQHRSKIIKDAIKVEKDKTLLTIHEDASCYY
jgi:hypothetical protein